MKSIETIRKFLQFTIGKEVQYSETMANHNLKYLMFLDVSDIDRRVLCITSAFYITNRFMKYCKFDTNTISIRHRDNRDIFMVMDESTRLEFIMTYFS